MCCCCEGGCPVKPILIWKVLPDSNKKILVFIFFSYLCTHNLRNYDSLSKC